VAVPLFELIALRLARWTLKLIGPSAAVSSDTVPSS
jgi:hypothetical protein